MTPSILATLPVSPSQEKREYLSSKDTSFLFHESREFLHESYLTKSAAYKLNSYWYDSRRDMVLNDFYFFFFNGLKTFYREDSSMRRSAVEETKTKPLNALTRTRYLTRAYKPRAIVNLSARHHILFVRPMVYLRKRSLDGEFYFYPRMRRIPSLNRYHLRSLAPLLQKPRDLWPLIQILFHRKKRRKKRRFLALFQAHKKLLRLPLLLRLKNFYASSPASSLSSSDQSQRKLVFPSWCPVKPFNAPAGLNFFPWTISSWENHPFPDKEPTRAWAAKSPLSPVQRLRARPRGPLRPYLPQCSARSFVTSPLAGLRAHLGSGLYLSGRVSSHSRVYQSPVPRLRRARFLRLLGRKRKKSFGRFGRAYIRAKTKKRPKLLKRKVSRRRRYRRRRRAKRKALGTNRALYYGKPVWKVAPWKAPKRWRRRKKVRRKFIRRLALLLARRRRNLRLRRRPRFSLPSRSKRSKKTLRGFLRRARILGFFRRPKVLRKRSSVRLRPYRLKRRRLPSRSLASFRRRLRLRPLLRRKFRRKIPLSRNFPRFFRRRYSVRIFPRQRKSGTFKRSRKSFRLLPKRRPKKPTYRAHPKKNPRKRVVSLRARPKRLRKKLLGKFPPRKPGRKSSRSLPKRIPKKPRKAFYKYGRKIVRPKLHRRVAKKVKTKFFRLNFQKNPRFSRARFKKLHFSLAFKRYRRKRRRKSFLKRRKRRTLFRFRRHRFAKRFLKISGRKFRSKQYKGPKSRFKKAKPRLILPKGYPRWIRLKLRDFSRMRSRPGIRRLAKTLISLRRARLPYGRPFFRRRRPGRKFRLFRRLSLLSARAFSFRRPPWVHRSRLSRRLFRRRLIWKVAHVFPFRGYRQNRLWTKSWSSLKKFPRSRRSYRRDRISIWRRDLRYSRRRKKRLPYLRYRIRRKTPKFWSKLSLSRPAKFLGRIAFLRDRRLRKNKGVFSFLSYVVSEPLKAPYSLKLFQGPARQPLARILLSPKRPRVKQRLFSRLYKKLLATSLASPAFKGRAFRKYFYRRYFLSRRRSKGTYYGYSWGRSPKRRRKRRKTLNRWRCRRVRSARWHRTFLPLKARYTHLRTQLFWTVNAPLWPLSNLYPLRRIRLSKNLSPWRTRRRVWRRRRGRLHYRRYLFPRAYFRPLVSLSARYKSQSARYKT